MRSKQNTMKIVLNSFCTREGKKLITDLSIRVSTAPFKKQSTSIIQIHM